MKKQLLFLLLLISSSSILNAQASGAFDPTFNASGYDIMDIQQLDLFQDVAVQSDNKIVAVGMSFNDNFISTAYIMRFLPSGELDTEFGGDGRFSLEIDNEANIYSVAISDEGKIIIAGSTTDYQDYKMLLIQVNPDGSIDNSFGTNGVVTINVGQVDKNKADYIFDVDTDTNGNIIVAGSSLDTAYFNMPTLVRFTPTGQLDETFGTNGVVTIQAINGENVFDCVKIQNDGKIVAAGHYSQGLIWFVLLVARYNEDGTLDTEFGDGGIIKYSYSNVDDEAFGLDITPTGNIVIAGFVGSQSYNYDAYIVQFKNNGQIDSTFGTNGVIIEDYGNFDVAEDIKVLDNGKIVVVGETGEGPPNGYDLAVWTYNSDGTPDLSFGQNGIAVHAISDYNVMLHGVDVQEDGKIIAVGQARASTGSENDFFIGRIIGDVSIGFADLTNSSSTVLYPNPIRSSETIQIKPTQKNITASKIELYNTNGQLIQAASTSNSKTSFNGISMKLSSAVSQGIYFVKTTFETGEISTSKLVVWE
jgi:uncharacterized delta-60 repeat protein